MLFFYIYFYGLGNLTEDSSTEERTERIPKEKKPSKQANMIVWISLAAILISLLLAGLIHRFCTCNSHSQKTLLDGTSPSKLDEESTTTDPTDLSSPVTLEERLTQGRYSLSFWKDYSKKTFDTSLSELDECSVTHPNRSVTRDCVTEECVTLEKVLAQGKFSDVWMGRFRGQIVALKIFPVTAISSWRKERYINSLLSEEHSNILKLISLNDAETQHNGNCPLWLMMDFCENGSLMDYLKSQVSHETNIEVTKTLISVSINLAPYKQLGESNKKCPTMEPARAYKIPTVGQKEKCKFFTKIRDHKCGGGRGAGTRE